MARKMVKQIKKTGRRKKWYDINAPKLFNNQKIGESIVYEPAQLMEKHISVNLMLLTRDMKKQSINAFFKVVNIENNVGLTECTGLEYQAGSIKRFVRREKERVDDSFLIRTKDNKIARIKPLMITRNNAHKSDLRDLRKMQKKLLKEFSLKTNFENLLNEIILGKLQKYLKEKLNKILPLRIMEIRSIKLNTKKRELKQVSNESEEKEEKNEEKKPEESIKDEAVKKEDPEEKEKKEDKQEKEKKKERKETKKKAATKSTTSH